MLDYFDLQLFAPDVDWSDGITITNASTSKAGTLYVDATGVVDAEKQSGTEYVATITLRESLDASAATTTVSNISSIKVTAAIADITLTTNPTLTITDTGTTKTKWTLGATNTVEGSSITLSDGSLTAFTDLVITGEAPALKASGTVTLGGKTATASGVTATLKPAAVEDFKIGRLVIPSGTTTLTLMGVAITGVGGTYEAKSNTDGDYIAATLSGTAQTLALTGATVPFYLTGTSGADKLTTSANRADTIVGGAGNDSIAVVSSKTVSIVGGAGSDTIDDADATTFAGNNSTISGGDGKDTIEFTAAFASDVSEVLFDGGADNDDIQVGTKIKNSTVLGGAGNDTLYSAEASNTLTGGAGTDYFNIGATTAGKALISDYKYGEDYIYLSAGAVVNDANAWASVAVGGNQTLSSDGNYGIIGDDGTNGAATISSSAGFFAVNLVDQNKDKLDLAWVGDSGSTVNGSSSTVSLVLTGRTNSEGDLLVGGSKNDTIYAGGSDSIYGGAGKDTLEIDAAANGVYVGIATDSGADVVTNFTTGFDIDTADAVYLVNGTSSDFGATYGTNLVLSHGSAKMTLGGATDGDAGTGTTDLLVSGQKVVVAKNGATITTDDLTYANYWIGTYDSTSKTGSAADFHTATDAVNINLGDTDHIRYIYTVTGGSGNTTLMGGANAESLVAASGSTTSLYGGAGKDTLRSSGDSKTEFFFMNGAGNDVIEDFTTGTDTDTSDVLNFYGSGLGSISRTDTGVVKIKTSDGSTLTVNQKSGGADEKLQWVSGEAGGVAKVAASSGGSLSYETDVTNYFGSSKKDTLAVNAGDGTDVNIWLDGSQGVGYSDIDVVDASGRAANTTIAGSAIAETITGGSGNASVWGGAGQVADVLKSTSGSTTMFFYGLGNGSDNISGSANDTVNLFDIKLSDIASANIQNSQVIFTTSSKDTVTVSGAQTFQLADGSKWTANYSTNQWEAAQ